MIRRFQTVALAVLLALACAAAPVRAEETPSEINQKAYALFREGQGAALTGSDRAAYDKISAAAVLYGEIARRFPEWNPPAIAVAKAQAEAAAAALGEKLFRLPEGCLKIEDGLVREGKRYAQGEALAPDVVKRGSDRYEVKGFLVELSRSGPLTGARCNCPDFRYRGSKFNYACEHIWAVVLKEKLLE